jgi:hypothetical protein
MKAKARVANIDAVRPVAIMFEADSEPLFIRLFNITFSTAERWAEDPFNPFPLHIKGSGNGARRWVVVSEVEAWFMQLPVAGGGGLALSA